MCQARRASLRRPLTGEGDPKRSPRERFSDAPIPAKAIRGGPRETRFLSHQYRRRRLGGPSRDSLNVVPLPTKAIRRGPREGGVVLRQYPRRRFPEVVFCGAKTDEGSGAAPPRADFRCANTDEGGWPGVDFYCSNTGEDDLGRLPRDSFLRSALSPAKAMAEGKLREGRTALADRVARRRGSGEVSRGAASL